MTHYPTSHWHDYTAITRRTYSGARHTTGAKLALTPNDHIHDASHPSRDCWKAYFDKPVKQQIETLCRDFNRHVDHAAQDGRLHASKQSLKQNLGDPSSANKQPLPSLLKRGEFFFHDMADYMMKTNDFSNARTLERLYRLFAYALGAASAGAERSHGAEDIKFAFAEALNTKLKEYFGYTVDVAADGMGCICPRILVQPPADGKLATKLLSLLPSKSGERAL